jgi:UDP-N-acetylmuramyl pentapeptide synthase
VGGPVGKSNCAKSEGSGDLASKILVITGALQVGKTTTVESIRRILVAQGVVLAASSRKGEGSAK